MAALRQITLYVAGAVAFSIAITYARIAKYISRGTRADVTKRDDIKDDDDIYFAGCGGFLP